MPHYRLFGGVLHSEVPMPGVRECGHGRANWRLTVAAHPAPEVEGVPYGEDATGGCRTRLLATARGYRYVHSCTGEFDIASDGRRMVWYPSPTPEMDVVRNDILGRLFAIGLHAGGALCLHGSGVAFDGETAAFLAPKGYGKSTLAGALIAAGASLVSDDTLAVTTGDVPMLQPGVHHLRLRSDSARHALEQPEAHPRGVDGKLVVSNLGDDRLLLVPRPLSAIYVLDPAPASAERAVVRTPLAVPFAAVALVQHVKSAVLLGPRSAPALLDRAARVVRHVPVFRLEIARSLARIAEVAETLAEWHGRTALLRATGA